MKNKPAPVDPLLAELASHLVSAGNSFTRGVHYLRVLKLLAQGQVQNLGNQSDLDQATPEQKAAWTVFVEISSVLQWFEQAALDFKNFSKPAETSTSSESKTDDTPPTTVH